MKQKTDYVEAAIAWIVFTIALVFLCWIIAGLYATFHSAAAAQPIQQTQPALIRVVGQPSAFRAPGDIYLRWHRCLGWCE